MTLRIHFTAADLARTTLAGEPDPLWEVLLSLHMLQVGDGPAQFGFWRRDTRRRLDGETAARLVAMAPPRGFYSPDFLTPARTPPGGFDDSLDAMLSTSRERIHGDLTRFTARERPSAWVRRLAEGPASTLGELGHAMRTYHRTAITPYWPRLRAHVRADHRQRADRLAAGGFDHLMSGLYPGVRWQSPVLEVLDFPDEDLRLDGRGLRLQPSYFCWQVPTKLYDPGLPPVLVYPIRHDRGPLRPSGEESGRSVPSLSALLGKTRARALELTVEGCTTTDLATRCGISLAAASHQAKVLRGAGLIRSSREGKTVRHQASPLGQALLAGRDPEPGDTGPRDQAAVPDPWSDLGLRR